MSIEKLEQAGILGDVREALGAKNPSDTSKDSQIKNLSNKELVGLHSQWELGDKNWGISFINTYLELEAFDNESKPQDVIINSGISG